MQKHPWHGNFCASTAVAPSGARRWHFENIYCECKAFTVKKPWHPIEIPRPFSRSSAPDSELRGGAKHTMPRSPDSCPRVSAWNPRLPRVFPQWLTFVLRVPILALTVAVPSGTFTRFPFPRQAGEISALLMNLCYPSYHRFPGLSREGSSFPARYGR